MSKRDVLWHKFARNNVRKINWLHFYLQKRGKLKQHVYVAIGDERLSRIGKVQEGADRHRTLVIQSHGTIATLSHIHLKHGPKPKAGTCTHVD